MKDLDRASLRTSTGGWRGKAWSWMLARMSRCTGHLIQAGFVYFCQNRIRWFGFIQLGGWAGWLVYAWLGWRMVGSVLRDLSVLKRSSQGLNSGKCAISFFRTEKSIRWACLYIDRAHKNFDRKKGIKRDSIKNNFWQVGFYSVPNVHFCDTVSLYLERKA